MRRPQFSLKTVLWLMAVVGVTLGLLCGIYRFRGGSTGDPLRNRSSAD